MEYQTGKYKAREGDFIETSEGLIFDVKGLVHPPNRIVAFLRYFPDKKGKRTRNGISYSKIYSLAKRYTLLKKKHPEYFAHDPVFGERICEVPVDAVEKHHKPTMKLRELCNSHRLDTTETLALQLAELVKETAKIPWNTIGISGSIMVGLHTPSSDIDPIVYGSENCQRVYSALKDLLSETRGVFKHYTQKDLSVLFEFRSTDTKMNYEDFVRTELRKVSHGKFLQRDYFIRFVKDWNEYSEEYGDIRYMNVGYSRVRATVVDDSESIFTPCIYKIDDLQVLGGSQIDSIEEIASFRGRFCEQARKGEVVVAQGKVERVTDHRERREHFRLLLGNRRSDYLILA